MKLGFTLHQITVGKERRRLPINSVQAFDDAEFDRLLKLTAVRVPTESELAIYEAINGKAEKSTKATKAEKPAKATKAVAQTGEDTVSGGADDATTNDPDEVEEI